MIYELYELPYAMDALEPAMSSKTLEYHHGKHHAAYVDNFNKLVIGTPYENRSIEEVICESDGALFNNAAQVWNHTLFFEQFAKDAKHKPEGELLEAIEISFGSFTSMKEQLSDIALRLFGSGWAWLVKDGNELSMTTTPNGYNPLRDGKTAIFTIDVWEHAYYIDYYNSRAKYLENIWKIVDWSVIERRMRG